MDVALAADNEVRRIPLRQLAGIYSLGWAVVFFATRSAEAGRILAGLAGVASELERSGGGATKVSPTAPPYPTTRAREPFAIVLLQDTLASTARSLRRTSLLYDFMALTQVAGVTQTIFAPKASAAVDLLPPRLAALASALDAAHVRGSGGVTRLFFHFAPFVEAKGSIPGEVGARTQWCK